MKVLGWIIMIPVVLFILLIAARVAFCGPDQSDVRVMKPMAEAISDYIIKHGIPKSLKDIPDLPYKLEGCKRKDYYRNYKSYNDVAKEDAKIHLIDEKCHFENIDLEFGFTNELNNSEIAGSLKMYSSNKTVLSIYFTSSNKATFHFEKLDIGSSKSSGICNPMRQ